MYKGSQKHLELKEQAKKILKSKGFFDDEIFEEYPFESFRIDVVGVRKKEIILIECGSLQPRYKVLLTKSNFIHLKYPKVNTKTIESLDENIWNKFVGYCKMRDKKVGEELNHILEVLLKQEVELKNEHQKN